MSNEKAAASQEEGENILKVLLPYLIVTALVSACLVLGVVKLTGTSRGSVSAGQTVVFDVVKLSNAQRAVASTLLKGGDKSAESATMLLEVSKRTRETIRKIAGANTLVLVKQGVVSPDLPDITEDVLKELGLPVQVPTQDAMGYLTDISPTYLSMLKQPPGRTPLPLNNGSSSILP